MIILLNGCINAGKSTVAQALVRLLKDAAHIELDDLRDCMPALPFEGRAFAITLEAAVALARVFVAHGLDCVLTWPLGQSQYDFLVAELRPLGRSIHAFTLDTDLDVLLTNRGGRELTDRERHRIREQHADGRHKPAFGTIIHNTQWPAERTAQHILTLLNGQGHRGSNAEGFSASGRG